MSTRLTTLAILLSVAAPCGCSDDNNQLTVCPAKGLGITAATGESCATALATDSTSKAAQDCLAQFSDYKKYDCVEPQIAFDKTKKVLIPEADPNSAFVDVYWTITNAAGGTNAKKLNIKAIGVAGDEGSPCFFKDPEIETREIEAGKQIFMRFEFKPLEVSEHHAAIYLISDAQNYPKMILPVCVKVVPKAVPPAPSDAGAGKDGGATTPDSAVIDFDCKDVTTVCNETCHPGCSAVLKM